jgi:hypothetical protein
MISSDYAPIAIFAYRRVGSLVSMLKSLQACPEYSRSPVFVFSDGPKNDAARKDVVAVRARLAALRTPNMTIVEAAENRGLAASIIGGVDQLTREFGRVIVLEDDLRVSPATLTWFNTALERYHDESAVMQISAYAYFIPQYARRETAVFLPAITTWGWATWDHAWRKFDPAATGWEELNNDPDLRRRFDLDGAYGYSKMLNNQMTAGIDSWGIRWYWSVFRSNGVVLFPPRSFVKNMGFDFKATHGAKSLALSMLKSWKNNLSTVVPAFPAEIKIVPDEFAFFREAVVKRKFW